MKAGVERTGQLPKGAEDVGWTEPLCQERTSRGIFSETRNLERTRATRPTLTHTISIAMADVATAGR